MVQDVADVSIQQTRRWDTGQVPLTNERIGLTGNNVWNPACIIHYEPKHTTGPDTKEPIREYAYKIANFQ